MFSLGEMETIISAAEILVLYGGTTRYLAEMEMTLFLEIVAQIYFMEVILGLMGVLPHKGLVLMV